LDDLRAKMKYPPEPVLTVLHVPRGEDEPRYTATELRQLIEATHAETGGLWGEWGYHNLQKAAYEAQSAGDSIDAALADMAQQLSKITWAEGSSTMRGGWVNARWKPFATSNVMYMYEDFLRTWVIMQPTEEEAEAALEVALKFAAQTEAAMTQAKTPDEAVLLQREALAVVEGWMIKTLLAAEQTSIQASGVAAAAAQDAAVRASEQSAAAAADAARQASQPPPPPVIDHHHY
jgi:hypothetical protein